MTTEHKVIGGIGLATILVLGGGVFLLSSGSTPSASKDQIITETGLHWHPKLTVTIKGKKQQLDDKIGLGAVHQKIHTHTEDYKDGVVHMEMQGVVTKDDTKIGNFFRIWGKEFSAKQIFDKINGSDGKVTMLVNGKKNTDFESYLMKEGDNIEIRYE